MSLRRLIIFTCILVGFWADGADVKVVAVYRSRADLAYVESRYDDALESYLFLRDKLADDEPTFLSASEGILKTVYAQRDFVRLLKETEEGGAIFQKPPRSGKTPLSLAGKATFAYWAGRVHLASSRPDAALKAFKSALGQGSGDRQAATAYQYGQCFIVKGELEKATTHFNSMKSSPSPAGPTAQAGRLGTMAIYLKRKQWDEFDKLLKTSEPLAKGRWDVELTIMQLRMLLDREQAVRAATVYRSKLLSQLTVNKNPYVRNHLKVVPFFAIVRRIGLEMTKAKAFRPARDFYVELQPALPRDDQQQEVFLDMAASAHDAMKHFREANASAEANSWFTLADDDLKRFLIKYKTSELVAKVAYYQGQLLRVKKHEVEAKEKFLLAFNHKKAPPLYRYEAAMQLADGAIRDGDRDTAEKWFATASCQSVDKPRKSNADFRRGELLSDMKKFDLATKAFTDFIAAYPNSELVVKARFNQGCAAFEFGDFGQSTEVFGNFLKLVKKDEPLRPSAMHFLGLSLRNEKKIMMAKQVFHDLENSYPTHELAPRALLDAAEIANYMEKDVEFISLCTKVINAYPKSEWVPYAIYKRIYHFLCEKDELEQAQEDMDRYFSDKTNYPKSHPDAAAEILMWFGDFQLRMDKLEKAGEYFLRSADEFPQSIHAHVALSEAAKILFVLSRKKEDKICARALDVLAKLESLPVETVDKLVLTKTYFLHAEVLAWQLRYEEAEEYFKKCREACAISKPPLNLYFPTITRIGDMNYVLAGRVQEPKEKKRLLNESVTIYSTVIDAELVRGPVRNKARYQRGLVNLLLKNDAEAYKDFRAVFEAYFDHRLHGEKFMLKSAPRLVEYYQSLGQIQNAMDVLKRIMEEVDDEEFVKWARKIAKELEGRVPKSLADKTTPKP